MTEKSNSSFTDKLIKVFDDLLEEDGWDSSFLLQVSKKRLVKARDALLGSLQQQQSESKEHVEVAELSSEQILVYVSLYHYGGSSLFFWESMLKVLSSCSLGRPIYSKEEDVRRAIDSRADLKKEGYVELVILKSDLLSLPKEKASCDANGVDLLLVKPDAIDASSVRFFVHSNKDKYLWQRGKLVIQK